jgi:hypothetical protein
VISMALPKSAAQKSQDDAIFPLSGVLVVLSQLDCVE